MESNKSSTRFGIAVRGFVVWLVIIAAEIVHGIARGILLVPMFGEFRSNQIGVFTGSIIILVIAYAFVNWIGALRPVDLLLVGLMWVGLTFVFEILFGRFVMGLSWERLMADYNMLAGGLMPLGLIFLGLSPLIAAKVQGIV